jgi:nucleoside-diphosphate-sugar epimerase
MSHILLTGSSGFIGSRLTKHLTTAGHRVTGLDIRPGVHTQVVADLRHPSVVAEVSHRLRSVDVVMHFAAVAGVRRSLVEPALYVDTNVTGTLHALQLAEALSADRVVTASSSSVYGSVAGPASEDTPVAPLSPYAASKVATEALCASWAAAGAFEVIVVRPFTVYGPGQRPDMFCHQALGKVVADETLQVWEWRRDFTYVDDLCVAAANTVTVDVPGGMRVYNLGSGRPVSVHEFLSTVQEVTGRQVRAVFGRSGHCEPVMTFADTSRSHAELGLPAPKAFVEGLAAQFANLYPPLLAVG